MNLYGVKAIYKFEMARMKRTVMQSVLSPVISTCLYFVVFGSAIGSRMGDIDSIAAGPATLAGMNAMATVAFAAPEAEARLDNARAVLDDLATAGASALPGVLVCRLVAPDTQTLRKTLVPLLAALAGRDLPRVWHL